MLHEETLRLKADRLSLLLGGVNEDRTGNKNPWHSAALEIGDVVHTARRTAASISERFDHRIAVGRDFMAEIDRRWFGERRLRISSDGCADVSESLFEAIEELVSSGLRNVEKPNSKTVETRGASNPFDGFGRLLGCWIENGRHADIFPCWLVLVDSWMKRRALKWSAMVSRRRLSGADAVSDRFGPLRPADPAGEDRGEQSGVAPSMHHEEPSRSELRDIHAGKVSG